MELLSKFVYDLIKIIIVIIFKEEKPDDEWEPWWGEFPEIIEANTRIPSARMARNLDKSVITVVTAIHCGYGKEITLQSWTTPWMGRQQERARRKFPWYFQSLRNEIQWWEEDKLQRMGWNRWRRELRTENEWYCNRRLWSLPALRELGKAASEGVSFERPLSWKIY